MLPSSLFLAEAFLNEQLAIICLIIPQSFTSATAYDIRGMPSATCSTTAVWQSLPVHPGLHLQIPNWKNPVGSQIPRVPLPPQLP
ncbi:unnamed protein product [Rotaria sordida]|uniref:Uncharacterized protein n=1 Tax=Rotaria sordida TaxID=392033 RepID=A0A815B1P7_9BILA|nr:unnamed protein product [Rotaria sordida]CAF3961113.1 unnamed protein product [Rotaria sordida]